MLNPDSLFADIGSSQLLLFVGLAWEVTMIMHTVVKSRYSVTYSNDGSFNMPTCGFRYGFPTQHHSTSRGIGIVTSRYP